MSSSALKEKWRATPNSPGVYVMKDAFGGVIYVGKAKNIKRRLANYFTASASSKANPKTRALIASIHDFDYHVVRSNKESLILEAKLIKQWRPRYNISLKDDKRYYLLRAPLNTPYPKFELTRTRDDALGKHWGPFPHSQALYATLDWLNKNFGLRTCTTHCPNEQSYKHCHVDIIRSCHAPCIGRVSQKEYRTFFDAACALLNGKGKKEALSPLREEIEQAALQQDFELAAQKRDILLNLEKTLEPARQFKSGRGLPSTVRPEEDLQELADYLGLPSPPSLMECFDISNVSSTHIVASMVRFKDGSPDSSSYRRYRVKTVEGQNDFASMAEVVLRRYSRLSQEAATLPDLIIVDGGKGQLSISYEQLQSLELEHIPLIGLAKQREEVFFPHNPIPLLIPHETGALKLLQRIRDEAHRFANNYNELLLRRRMAESRLDSCPGMTAKRKALLFAHFKSLARLKKAPKSDLLALKGVSRSFLESLYEWLQS